jgi:hypothetical protein
VEWTRGNEDDMNENNDSQHGSISKGRSLEDVADYWDSHSLADHWDQTREVEFEVRAPRRITLEPDVYARLQEQAETSGVPLVTLVNSWLKERLTNDKAA